MFNFILGLIIGVFTGGVVGMIIAALCSIASRNDKRE